jgi:hypothetical protein
MENGVMEAVVLWLAIAVVLCFVLVILVNIVVVTLDEHIKDNTKDIS